MVHSAHRTRPKNSCAPDTRVFNSIFFLFLFPEMMIIISDIIRHDCFMVLWFRTYIRWNIYIERRKNNKRKTTRTDFSYLFMSWRVVEKLSDGWTVFLVAWVFVEICGPLGAKEKQWWEIKNISLEGTCREPRRTYSSIVFSFIKKKNVSRRITNRWLCLFVIAVFLLFYCRKSAKNCNI